MKKRSFCKIEGIGQFKKYCQDFAIRKNTWFFIYVQYQTTDAREQNRGKGKWEGEVLEHIIVSVAVHSSIKSYTFAQLLFMACTIKSSVCKEFTHLSIKIKEMEKVDLICIKNLEGCRFPK